MVPRAYRKATLATSAKAPSQGWRTRPTGRRRRRIVAKLHLSHQRHLWVFGGKCGLMLPHFCEWTRQPRGKTSQLVGNELTVLDLIQCQQLKRPCAPPGSHYIALFYTQTALTRSSFAPRTFCSWPESSQELDAAADAGTERNCAPCSFPTDRHQTGPPNNS